ISRLNAGSTRNTKNPVLATPEIYLRNRILSNANRYCSDVYYMLYLLYNTERPRMHQAEVKNNRSGRIEQRSQKLFRENASWARKALGRAFVAHTKVSLEALTREFGFSVSSGDLQIINSNWYVTHTGLIRLARRKKCRSIHVEAVDSLCDSAASRFVLKATVYPSKSSTGFVGYGDADPSNVSFLVHGAEMRVAETRAVNRALRKPRGWD